MSNNPNSGPGVTWKVTQQVEKVGVLPDGRFGQGVEVFFQMSNGTSGSVFIPRTDYSPDMVSLAVTEKARAMHIVGRLSGQL